MGSDAIPAEDGRVRLIYRVRAFILRTGLMVLGWGEKKESEGEPEHGRSLFERLSRKLQRCRVKSSGDQSIAIGRQKSAKGKTRNRLSSETRETVDCL